MTAPEPGQAGDAPAGDVPAAQPGADDARSPAAAPILNLDRLSLHFGGLQALAELDLVVDDRRSSALITQWRGTVFNASRACTSRVPVMSGLAGRSICWAGPAPDHLVSIARTFQRVCGCSRTCR